MKAYSHLRLEERELLFCLREQGLTFREIGKELGRDHTSLSREYGRNAKYGRPYIPCRAEKKTRKRGEKQRRKAPLKNPLVYLYVREKLRNPKERWSPETIAGRLPHDHPGETIHHETIYRYIYSRKKSGRDQLWQYLTLHRKKRMKKNGRKVKPGKIEAMLPIEMRPEAANLRQEVGHWETDNMEGKRSDRTAVSVTVERVSRLTSLAKLTDHKADTKSETVIGGLDHQVVKSITADRGPENRKHQLITKGLNIPIYFCNPYHSWEKGTVENTVGRIRRFLPKGKSLDTVSEKQIRSIELHLNNTPRKCLGFLTPCEKLGQLQINNSGALPARM